MAKRKRIDDSWILLLALIGIALIGLELAQNMLSMP